MKTTRPLSATSSRCLLLLALVAAGCSRAGSPKAAAPMLGPGHHDSVAVLEPTRFDWQFVVVPNKFEPSSPNLPSSYRSTDQRYELFVPDGYDSKTAHALILCVSPGSGPTGWNDFQSICRDHQVIFASPYGTGNTTPFAIRARVTLDVLDDVRRRLNIDPDRVYLAGFSGGGRVAARVAFALPEACAGAMPICAAYSLREEPWVHLRVAERLSVVLLHGDVDPWRVESEREYSPILQAYHVRSKFTTYPGGHIAPPQEVLKQSFDWLEEGLEQRRALAGRFPASRMDRPLSGEEWSTALVEEAEGRLRSSDSKREGLLQLAGVSSRWKGLPAASRAEEILERYDGKSDLSWRQVVHDEQLHFSLLQSRAFDDHMQGPEPVDFPASREPLWRMLEESWRETLALAKGTPDAAEAEAHLASLAKRKKAR